MTKLKMGLNLPLFTDTDPARVADVGSAARHAEELGFESVWAPDLIIGDGTPGLESTTVLASVAAGTTSVRLGFGVLVVPLRRTVWLAAQLATLQHLSGDRVLLGVGSGGFPAAPFWRAAGASGRHRGRMTDRALQALPGLLAGNPVSVENHADDETVTLAPAAPMPPVLVGGTSAAAIRRAAAYGDAWFPSLIAAEHLGPAVTRLRDLATERGRATPTVTVGVHYLPDDRARQEFTRSLVEDHGRQPDEVDQIAVTGTPAQLAERFHEYALAGADRLVLAPGSGSWTRHAELIGSAHAKLS